MTRATLCLDHSMEGSIKPNTRNRSNKLLENLLTVQIETNKRQLILTRLLANHPNQHWITIMLETMIQIGWQLWIEVWRQL